MLTAPLREPLEGLRLEVIEKLDYSLCTVCGCLFLSGITGKSNAHLERATGKPGHLGRAANAEKGLIYWLTEQSNRSPDAQKQLRKQYHRRYLCPDCVEALFGHLATDE